LPRVPRWLIRLALAGAVILAARPAAAQVSIWLQKGVSGFGGAFTFSGSSDMLGLSLGGGYSYKGVLELDLRFARYFPDSDDYDGLSVEVWEIAPSIEVHPLKQSANVPISLGISAGVTFPFYSADVFDEYGISASAFGYGFGLSAYRFFRLTESVGVIPTVGLEWMHRDISVENSVQKLESSSSTFGGVLCAYFAFIDSGGRIWGLVPAVGINEDGLGYHLGFASVFSMP
jgi:hypothetical protein